MNFSDLKIAALARYPRCCPPSPVGKLTGGGSILLTKDNHDKLHRGEDYEVEARFSNPSDWDEPKDTEEMDTDMLDHSAAYLADLL